MSARYKIRDTITLERHGYMTAESAEEALETAQGCGIDEAHSEVIDSTPYEIIPFDCPTCGSQLTSPIEDNTAGALPPNYCTECDREYDITQIPEADAGIC